MMTRRLSSAVGAEMRLDAVFAALSDVTRRRLLARLARGPASVTELAAPFDMSLPAVSKHLRVLERAGLMRRTVGGREHQCRLEPAALAKASAFLQKYRVFWEENLDSLARYVERRK